MFSVKTIMTSAALVGAAFAIGAPGTALAGVVIKSSGPSASQYPVGKKLSDRGRITLKAGDTVTVLAGGKTRVIKGAGQHRVAARGTSNRSTFATLTRQRANARKRTGAIRGGNDAAAIKNGNLWNVDVSKPGTICVSDLASVSMWRPSRGDASTFVVAKAGTTEHAHINFADGETNASWDNSAMALSEGTEYSITGPGLDAPVTMQFVQLETTPTDAESMAEVLIAKGCAGQLDLLATEMM